MALAEFGSDHDSELLERHSKQLLDRHGELACEAAHKLHQTNLSDDTIRSYKPQVRDVISGLCDDNPESEEAVEYIGQVDKSGSTKQIMLMAMQKYYEVSDEPAKVQKLKEYADESGNESLQFNRSMEVEEWLVMDEVQTVLDHIMPSSDKRTAEIGDNFNSWVMTQEHKALFATLYYTAGRVGEVVLLEIDDFYFDSNEIKVYRLKKDGEEIKRDMIAVPDEYMGIMEDYLSYYDIVDGKVFDFTTRTAQNRITDIHEVYEYSFGEFIHTDKLTPHKLRHSRVTHIANNSDLDKAGEYVDHSSPEVTEAYRHMSTEDQRDILPETSSASNGEVGGDGSDEIHELMGELDITDHEELKSKLEALQAIQA